MPFILGFLCLSLPLSIAGINIALGLLTAWVLRAPRRFPLRAIAAEPVAWALILYCFWSVVSSFLGVDPARSLGFLYKDAHKLLAVLIFLAVFRSAVSSETPLPRIADFLFVAFSLAACAGIVQVLRSIGTPHLAAWPRAHGFIHPVTYGEIMAVGALGSASFLSLQSPRPGQSTVLALVCGILSAVAVVLSQTRGAFLGLLAGLVVVFIGQSMTRRKALVFAAAAACLMLVEFSAPMGGRSLSRLLVLGRRTGAAAASSPILESRSVLWPTAWRMFRDHPWTGAGPANYYTLFPRYFSGTLEGEKVWGSSHDLFLQQLAERGAIGELVLLIVIGGLLWTAFQDLRRKKTWPALWAASSMTAFILMNVTEVAFQVEQACALILFIWAWSRCESRGENGRTTAD